jgi:hypothetical protein
VLSSSSGRPRQSRDLHIVDVAAMVIVPTSGRARR